MNKKLFSLVALFILSFATVGAQTFISPTGTQKIGYVLFGENLPFRNFYYTVEE